MTEMLEMLDLIKCSLWGGSVKTVTEEIYKEMAKHAITALPAPILSQISIPTELRQRWETFILRQIASYIQYTYAQNAIPITVPYVILKGTSAAQYYPHPELRIMGDIDIITRREDFETAYHQLLDHGFRVVKDIDKEICLTKNGVLIEIHRYFASVGDPKQAKYLDDLIIDNINSSHLLPDLVNGIVLLEHIDKHMEGGLGLRQIIDWMMFVDKCLPDEAWPEFQKMAAMIGIEKFAIATTQMCVMYLGLSPREWCSGANPDLCEQLMEYILASGNFGNKKDNDSDISKGVFFSIRSPKTFFSLLQKSGLTNWEAAQKYRWLRPFAWYYQLIRYIKKGLGREKAVKKVKSEYQAANERKALFDALDIIQSSKGRIKYQDGQYIRQ